MMDSTIDATRNIMFSAETAAQQVEKFLAKDSAAPSLPELMNVTPQNEPTASGLTDHDYPSLTDIYQNVNMTQIKTLKKVPLPPEIMEHFSHMQFHCMMGLFTEIDRAWLTIDSDIYLWTYESASDVAYYDGLNETIISVGLVHPKPGVFQNFIKYLLVLNTAVDIVVLGVTFTSNNGETMSEIQLVPEPVFTIPTDGSTITTVAGTTSGRLFLGSKDGSLYEITYQAESSWFGKRFKKVNHSTSTLSFLVPSFLNAALNEEDGIAQIVIDNSRNILYTLSEKGVIEVCDMGRAGKSFSRIISISQKHLVQLARDAVRTLDSQNFRPIVSISAVEIYESSHIHLVAITQTGIRLYLTTVRLCNTGLNQRPYTLALLHVRLPPGYSANMVVRPRMVHMAHYRNRNSILLSSNSEKDVLWCISSDLFPFSPSLKEAYTTITLDGPALALAEIHQDVSIKRRLPSPPSIVTQHIELPKKYVVLTAQGAHIFLKLRPVDLLRQLLVDSRGQDNDAIKAFFTIQQADQACATSLILACLDSPQNQEVAEHATRVFFLFGGEPKVAINPQTNLFAGTTFSPNVVSTPLGPQSPYQYQSMSPNLSYTQTPQQYQQNISLSPNISQMQNIDANIPFQFSSKHNGLYLYLGRILRPLWNLSCVEQSEPQMKKIYLVSSITSTECLAILSHLNALRAFFQQNTQLSICNNNSVVTKSTLNASTTINQTKLNYTMQDAQLEERHSLDAFKIFVNHCCQVIGLWKILCEHQFHILIDALQEQHKQMLQNATFKDLLLYGKDLCSVLITNLINSYLGDNASVDSISQKLRDVCPDLYRNEDAAYSKANEILKTARNLQNLAEKEDLILSALELCKSVAPNVNLHEICQQFAHLKAYHAVIELCVLCANKIDSGNVGVLFYKKSEQNDQEGYQYYTRRMEIYKEILFMLESSYVAADLPSFTAPPDDGTQNNNPHTESNLMIKRVIDDCLQHTDELLHVAVYEWMIGKNMMSDVIQIKQSTLETYLVKAAQENPNNVIFLELLWKYYESNNNHASAAKVLNNLASKTGTILTLQDRVGYLARSIMCMRSDKVGYAPYLGVFLRELEDKIEIAKVQEKILDSLINLRGTHPNIEEAIRALNSGLYEITQLYEDFAEPFQLWECKLAIIDCAGYSDVALVQEIWKNILNSEMNKCTGTGTDKMVQILSKVKILARACKLSSNCFPLAFIIRELETLSANLKADVSLVPNLFIAVEVPLELLITTYNQLMCMGMADRFWSAEENEFHFCEVLTVLINTFVCTQDSYNSVEKRKLIATCQDTVAGILSHLYSKPNTERLINALRAIQIQLSRL